MKGKMKDIEMKKIGLQKAILSLLVEWKDLQALLDTKMFDHEKCKNPMSEKLKEIDLNDGPCENLTEVVEIEGKKLKKMVGNNEVLREIEGKMREMEFSKSFIEERAKELEVREKEIDDGYRDLEMKRMEVAKKSVKVDERAKELELREKEIYDGYEDLELKKMEVAEKSEKADAKLVEIEEQKLKLEERWEKVSSSEKEVERLQVLCEKRCEEIVGKVREVDSSRRLLEEYAKELELKRKELENGFKETGSKKMEFTQMTNKFGAINFSNADASMNQTKRKRSSYNLRCRSPVRTELPAPQVHQTVTSKNSDGDGTFWTRRQDVNMSQITTKGYKCAEGKSLHGSNKTIKKQVKLVTVGTLDPDTRAASVINDSESNQNQGLLPSVKVVDCPYPEFSDFDKEKDEKCFSVDQIWACYDSLDVMPILYGHIRKVFSPDFKLQVTFLKANPDEQSKINWVNAGFPMVCGKFIHDDTTETSNRLTFSHQVHFEKGSDGDSYLIYPRKGETWALFKDWNIGWSSDPANHRTFKYQMVEILSDFKQETGVEICYLEKVRGFVSVFRRVARDGIVTFLVPSSEMLRFSHSVPSTKLTGAEREGVPAGAFELDPASLPTDPNKLSQPEEMEWKEIHEA
ncbi:hypothetical protein POM88_000567 [Heracleum sosnowskyi]|uniref:DUF3444 domain-containing protein n=1 Tax=Heracleum sosnowskyi TaxID=360622 RepID=A0AAD8JEJ4_9APIA|nr:hypothetical protein POM88_000567 [Heracleum sosnowskyi]